MTPPPLEPHRVIQRRPGCLAVLVAFIVSFFVMAIPASFIEDATGHSLIPATLLILAGTFGVLHLMGRASRKYIPICPHCGVDTDTRFRICRACGRVK